MPGLQRLIKYWISPFGAHGLIYETNILSDYLQSNVTKLNRVSIKWEIKYVWVWGWEMLRGKEQDIERYKSRSDHINKNIVTFVAFSVYARCHAVHFTCFFSSVLTGTLWNRYYYYHPLYWWGNWGLSNTYKVIQLLSGRVTSVYL